MYRLIVHVNGASKPSTFEFLEDTARDAHSHAEHIAQTGFWVDGKQPEAYMPPSRIKLIEVVPPKTNKAGRRI